MEWKPPARCSGTLTALRSIWLMVPLIRGLQHRGVQGVNRG